MLGTGRVIAIVAVIASLVAGFASVPARAAGPPDAAQFIDTLVGNATATLRDTSLAPPVREERLRVLLAQNFDMPRVARYVLGRYWTTASEDERKEFTNLFEQWVVRSYAARLAEYRDENVKVTGARAESDTGAVVSSQIVHTAGPPTRVEWRVRNNGGTYHIIDIDVEGVSLALTERDQIAAVIQRNGGTVAALNRNLADRVNGLTAAAEPAK
jgi:phospholipid transport system substrate-binding protein